MDCIDELQVLQSDWNELKELLNDFGTTEFTEAAQSVQCSDETQLQSTETLLQLPREDRILRVQESLTIVNFDRDDENLLKILQEDGTGVAPDLGASEVSDQTTPCGTFELPKFEETVQSSLVAEFGDHQQGLPSTATTWVQLQADQRQPDCHQFSWCERAPELPIVMGPTSAPQAGGVETFSSRVTAVPPAVPCLLRSVQSSNIPNLPIIQSCRRPPEVTTALPAETWESMNFSSDESNSASHQTTVAVENRKEKLDRMATYIRQTIEKILGREALTRPKVLHFVIIVLLSKCLFRILVLCDANGHEQSGRTDYFKILDKETVGALWQQVKKKPASKNAFCAFTRAIRSVKTKSTVGDFTVTEISDQKAKKNSSHSIWSQWTSANGSTEEDTAGLGSYFGWNFVQIQMVRFSMLDQH